MNDVFHIGIPPDFKTEAAGSMDNVILNPHGMAWTDELYRENGVGACDNILTILRGKVPRYTVNREVVERPGLQAKLQSLHNRWTMVTG